MTIGQTVRPAPVYRDQTLQLVFAVTLAAVLAVSSITPAFPQISRELNVSPAKVGWLISAFTVPGVLLMPIIGFAADRWGRKTVLVPSLMLFGLAGGACALADTFETLLLLRLLQGIGGASLGILNLTIISDFYSGRMLTEAMGYNASVLSVGTAGYPAIGGALALAGWNYPFLLALFAIPVGLLVLWRLPAVELAPNRSIRRYVIHLGRALATREIAAIMIATVTTFIMLFGSYLTFFPVLLADALGSTALTIGLLMSSVSLVTAVASAFLGRLATRFRRRTLARIGFVLFGVALILFPMAESIWQLVIPLAAFGVASALTIPTLLAMLAEYAPADQRAAFMSVAGMLLRLGQTLGPPLIGALVALAGVDAAFYAGAALAIATAVVVLLSLPDSRRT